MEERRRGSWTKNNHLPHHSWEIGTVGRSCDNRRGFVIYCGESTSDDFDGDFENDVLVNETSRAKFHQYTVGE